MGWLTGNAAKRLEPNDDERSLVKLIKSGNLTRAPSFAVDYGWLGTIGFILAIIIG